MAVKERPPLTIVLDTNVIVAALLQDGIVRALILGNAGVFATPEACIREIWEHVDEWNRRGLRVDVLRKAIVLLKTDFITVLPHPAYGFRESEARLLVPDPDDIPVVALGLALESDGIWTFNARDFSKPELLARIRILTTQDVVEML